MIRCVLALAAAGCAVPAATARVDVVFEPATLPPWVDEAAVFVRDLTARGLGPSGAAAITVEVGRDLDLAEPDEPLAVELEAGTWQSLGVTVALEAHGDVPAVGARGEGDGRYTWFVPAVDVAGDGAIEVVDGGPGIVVRVGEAAWGPLEGAAGRVDPGDDGYAEALAAWSAAATVEFPGAE